MRLPFPFWRPIESSRKLTACSQYLTLFDSPTDVVLLLPASQLDRALRSNPLNLVTLIRYCVQRLEQALTSGHVGSSSDDRERQVLNAVRVLSRVVPLILAPREPDGSVDEFEEALFWSEDDFEGLGQSQGDDDAREGQFVLADEDEEEGDSIEAQQSRAAAPPLAERLLGALVDLLFLPGLTLPRSIASEGAGVVHAIWCGRLLVLVVISTSRRTYMPSLSICPQGTGHRFASSDHAFASAPRLDSQRPPRNSPPLDFARLFTIALDRTRSLSLETEPVARRFGVGSSRQRQRRQKSRPVPVVLSAQHGPRGEFYGGHAGSNRVAHFDI